MPLPGALIQQAMTEAHGGKQLVTRPWLLWLNSLAQATSGAAAPANAGYIVDAANGALPNARVATTSTDTSIDLSVANVIKWFLTVTGITAGTYGDSTHVAQFTVDAKGRLSAASNVAIAASGINQLTGDVTAGPGTGSQVATIPDDTVTYAKMQDVSAPSLLLGHGDTLGTGEVEEITLGSGLSMTGTTLSASGSGITQLTGDVTAGPGSGSQAATIANQAVTYAKIQNTASASVLIGRGAGGGAGTVEEIALGTGLSMSGTTLSATAGGTVTTTGSPASGNLTKFSGATSITNGDLSGDVTTSGTLVTTLSSTGVTANTYGDSTHVSVITVDVKGRITAASNAGITASGVGATDDNTALAWAVAF